MKKSIIPLSAIFLILGSCNSPSSKNEPTHVEPMKSKNVSQNFNLDTTNLKSGQTYYQCPMDLEVISDKAGACPKCGMDLKVMTKK